MRLKTVYPGVWRITAPMGANSNCELLEELEALAANRRTEATVAKFARIWKQIPHQGPHSLPSEMYHRVDEEHEIYEFRARDHRILCFLADGRVVVCSHVFLKQSNRTPASEKRQAIAVRIAYLAAKRAGELEIVE